MISKIDWDRFYTDNLSKNTIGYEKFHAAVATTVNQNSGYPPYDVRKIGNDLYVIEVALAGFKKEELSITVQENLLTISGEKNDEDQKGHYIYKGIAMRAFKRVFTMAETIVVRGADFKDGILTVTMEDVIPQEKKPRKIEIGEATEANEGPQLLNE